MQKPRGRVSLRLIRRQRHRNAPDATAGTVQIRAAAAGAGYSVSFFCGPALRAPRMTISYNVSGLSYASIIRVDSAGNGMLSVINDCGGQYGKAEAHDGQDQAA